MMNRADLRAALSHPNVQAFARVVREGESRQDDWAYRMRYGGLGKRPEYFQSFDDHPRVYEPTVGGKRSSAAGAYQATATTWDEERRKYGWPDFSPASQDEFFVARLIYRKALDAVIAGDFARACNLCKDEWTSLPGGMEANNSTSRAHLTYEKWGGKFGQAFNQDTLATEHYGETVTESTINPVPSADEQEAHMAPIILPLLQIAAQFLPQLAEKFGSGSEVANRNLAAGKVLADAIVTATNSPNLQAAVEKMQSDPEAVKAAKVAVAQEWPELFEVAGGISAARKMVDYEGVWWHKFASLPFAVIIMLMPMIYFVIYHVITGVGWTQEIRASVVSAVISGVLFAIVGFALGTSYGSQRKTNILANKE